MKVTKEQFVGMTYEELLAENAKLREYIERKQHLQDFARLVTENSKLRELLTFYLGCLTKGHVNCDSCAISGDEDCGHGRMVIDKARELGIEVQDES